MSFHDGNNWSARALRAIDVLNSSANIIMAVDGDRDHMNASRLSCEQTQQAARLMQQVSELLSQKVNC